MKTFKNQYALELYASYDLQRSLTDEDKLEIDGHMDGIKNVLDGRLSQMPPTDGTERVQSGLHHSRD